GRGRAVQGDCDSHDPKDQDEYPAECTTTHSTATCLPPSFASRSHRAPPVEPPAHDIWSIWTYIQRSGYFTQAGQRLRTHWFARVRPRAPRASRRRRTTRARAPRPPRPARRGRSRSRRPRGEGRRTRPRATRRPSAAPGPAGSPRPRPPTRRTPPRRARPRTSHLRPGTAHRG